MLLPFSQQMKQNANNVRHTELGTLHTHTDTDTHIYSRNHRRRCWYCCRLLLLRRRRHRRHVHPFQLICLNKNKNINSHKLKYNHKHSFVRSLSHSSLIHIHAQCPWIQRCTYRPYESSSACSRERKCEWVSERGRVQWKHDNIHHERYIRTEHTCAASTSIRG